MGIVVSSRQASNILWHSVTCLNAICVLISSLQPPWPLEKRGVRWFSFFHSPLLLLCLQFCLSVSLSPHVVPCPFSLTLCPFALSSFTPTSVVSLSVRGGILSPDKGCLSFFYALVCHLVSRHRQIHGQTDRLTTCSSMHLCPSTLRLRCTTCQPAVFLREEKVNE